MADSSSAKGRRKKKGSGAQRASVDGALTEIRDSHVSVPPPGSAAASRRNDQNDVSGDGLMYCSACGRQYSAAVVEESVARAKMMW